jgi:glucose-1-phosphate thymidylyltransferase
MKGIVLAGGSGTRLHPITKGVSKQLLPIYDKPMIYYPISALIQAGITEILIISSPDDLSGFQRLLGDGSKLGISFSYAEQPSPDGLAQAFIIGKKFIKNDNVCLVLGDNFFYGDGFEELVKRARINVEENQNAVVFGYYVKDPERYGVVEFDDFGKAQSIEEKPTDPKSNYAVIGLYFYPSSVVKIAENIKPSSRGELEITSINEEYLNRSELIVNVMGRNYSWLDTGTHDSLFEAGKFVKVLEKRRGIKIGCIEENSLKQGLITKSEALKLGEELSKTDYGQYLIKSAIQWK